MPREGDPAGVGQRLTKAPRAIRAFLWFWRRVDLPPEMRPNTSEGKEYEQQMDALCVEVDHLKPETLEFLLPLWRDEYKEIRADIDTLRSRGGQLLAVTGFLTVLVSLSTGLPTTGVQHALAITVLALLAFFFIGTVWLTYHVIRVDVWEQVLANPVPSQPSGEVETARQVYAKQLLKAAGRLRMRMRVPAGYLRDAYRYFALTSVLVLALVCLKYGSPTSASPVSAGPTPVATPHATPTATPRR
jgi:hypothetical protein